MGRLGILVRLVLRMVPNTPVTRTLIKSDFGGLADQVKATQEVYNAALASKDAAAVAAALKRLDETQVSQAGYSLPAHLQIGLSSKVCELNKGSLGVRWAQQEMQGTLKHAHRMKLLL